jgi:DGQHR domain-containing protein
MAASKKSKSVIRRRALRLNQGDSPIYQFCLRGDELLQIADISRIERDEAGKLLGYQRPGVRQHIRGIVEYLDQQGGGIIFPNSIILALSSRVEFVKSRGPNVDDGIAEAGTLEIPVPGVGALKPAWIVDGQQRALAISQCKRKDLPIPVNAFVTDDVETQRDQFLRVNNSKPLPRGLVTELLPEVFTSLPRNLAARQIPSSLCNLLNTDKHSPFCGLIRRTSTSNEARSETVVADNSIIQMIQESISSPTGCLFPYRNIATGEADLDAILKMLLTYWRAVRAVFPKAWGKPPSASRLMHGAGIRAMGRLMDKIMSAINIQRSDAQKRVEEELRTIAPLCRWTDGEWDELGGMAWSELQNVPRHINALSNLLIRAYVHGMSDRQGFSAQAGL